ncbi:MAG: hypothetical protein JNM76_07310 [Betaproteobacteria bacterium]|nr:hypothetical protein [Betaproteobacteria bacterium]
MRTRQFAIDVVRGCAQTKADDEVRVTTVVWINGPFGVGKTSAAADLARRLPSSMTFNPEVIGSALALLTLGRARDFQDIALWRTVCSLALRGLARLGFRFVIVPMTVLNVDYLAEILKPLRDEQSNPRLFVLDVTEATLRCRIACDRSNVKAAEWRYANIGQYLDSRSTLAEAGELIDTNNLSAQAVAGRITACLA